MCNDINFYVRTDLCSSSDEGEALWIEIVNKFSKDICGCSTAKLCQRTVLGNRSLVWLSAMFFGFLHCVVLVREIVLHRLA